MSSNELHHFRIATLDDKPHLLAFLKDQWNAEHIYLKCDSFFDYDYLFGDNLNFLLAINQDQQIDGMLGFILYSPEYNGSDIFTVLWKVRPKNGDPMLGMTLLEKLISDFGFRVVSTVGANKKTLPIYEFMGYTTGQLKHYFILNNQLPSFHICQNTENVVGNFDPVPPADKRLISFETFDNLRNYFNPEKYKERIPYKSPQYINKRYFNHPFYTYCIFGVADITDTVNSIVIAREIIHQESKVLRLVDFIGEPSDLMALGPFLKEYMHLHGYEYVDFYQYGIDHDTMLQAGFLLKDDYKDLVIPNYFDPFHQANVSINFFTAAPGEFYIFKADGDQDRPNRI